MSKRTIMVVVVLVVLVCALAGWNAAWRYDEAVLFTGYRYERVKVRTHVFSGASEQLTGQGWVPLDPQVVRKP